MTRLYLDTSNLDQIKSWSPVISGVTTNPSILKNEGGDLVEICKYMSNRHVSVESGRDFLSEAKELYKWLSPHNPNIAIKVPFLDTEGTPNIHIIRALTDSGISVNCTAMLSLSQIILASKAGAKYVSLFAGRIDDEGGNYKQVIKDCIQYLDSNYFDKGCELIVGSVRTVGNVLDSVNAGAHIVTITPAVLQKMVTHKYSLFTSNQFEDDYVPVKDIQVKTEV